MLMHHANTRKHSASDTRKVATSRDSTGETIDVSDRTKRRVRSQVADVTKQARPFKCTQCDKAYTSKSSLTEHIERKHSDGKTAHECPVCGAGFVRGCMRDSHMLSHSAGKLFDCETCGARFMYEANLRRHLQQQHS